MHGMVIQLKGWWCDGVLIKNTFSTKQSKHKYKLELEREKEITNLVPSVF